MSLVTDKPDGLHSGNDLDYVIDPDDNDAEPAYLSFGSTPAAMSNPPEVGEKRTYIVRVECTGQSESVRTDGEHRYGRKLSILWAVEKGKAEPPDPDADQPSLFDDEHDEDGEDGADTDLDDEACGRPPFSDDAE
ncbi:hypothetical protein [Mycolicibacter minnesotensis]